MNLKAEDKIRITGFNCGRACHHRYSCMGIIVGKILTIKVLQPFYGPIVVTIDGSEYTIGRGMFEKLEYEEVD